MEAIFFASSKLFILIPVFPRLLLASLQPALCAQPAETGECIARAANFARTLANRPGNCLVPQQLANEARALARKYSGLSVRVMLKDQLVKAGFGALTAVGSGSAHPPVLIEVLYRGGKPKEAPVALVGKGITFDSGGICLKPASKMEDMKFDMCGAAAVLSAMGCLKDLALPIWTKILETIPAICVPIEIFSVLASTMPDPATEV